jgi:hypothetical protein
MVTNIGRTVYGTDMELKIHVVLRKESLVRSFVENPQNF